jgi:hypothetical protein
MPQVKHYAKKYKRSLIRDLIAELESVGESVVITAGNLVESIIRRTLRYSTQFGSGGPTYLGGGRHKEHPGFRDADVSIDYEVSVTKKGMSLKLYVTVIDPSGNPHFVWHLLSEGRKAFIQKKKSPPIRARRGQRTTPDVLEADSFAGFDGDVFVIHEGQRVQGIEARNWYKAVVDQLKVELKNTSEFSNLKLYGIEFKSHRIRTLL